MKEIGGYFELEQLINKPFHENNIRLNSGRAALAYLIQTKKIREIYIPFFLCDSIKNYISKLNININIKFYHVNDKFEPLIPSNITMSSSCYLYVVNFYGQLAHEYLNKLNRIYNNIIIDNTHDFFSKPIPGIDTIYSCRKFFGVPDGAYLYTDKVSNKKIDDNKIINNMKHIIGRLESSASSYYTEYVDNDLSFASTPILYMSKYSQIVLGAIDYKLVQNKRNINYFYLEQCLSEFNELDINHYNGPYCYPLMIKNAEKIRDELINHKIYIPTLWSDVLKVLDEKSIEANFVRNILPIPCDQRYDKKDMIKIVELIKKYITL